MQLISKNLKEELKASLGNLSEKLIIASAFIKIDAITEIFGCVDAGLDVSVVSRWQKGDLVVGSSDLEVYKFCKERGWKFGINNALHGKVYAIDNVIYIGSANLTRSGFNLSNNGNFEISTKIIGGEDDLSHLKKFLNSEVRWLDDELFQMIVDDVDKSKQENPPIVYGGWNNSIKDKLIIVPKELLLADLLLCSPEELLSPNFDNKNVVQDFSMLGLEFQAVGQEVLKECFRRTALYRWVCFQLKHEGEMPNGRMRDLLHDAVPSVPKVRRGEVVSPAVNTVFEWLKFLGPPFEVIKPNHREVARLKKING